jgi:hypothetical protein
MALSEKKLAANRANAQKSKGPVSHHGKRNSSRNGTKHGVLASVLLIEGESHERFAAQWRQQRAWAIEAAFLTNEMKNQPASQTSTDPANRAMLAVRSIGDHSHPLDLMSRPKNEKNKKMPREPSQPEQNQQISGGADPIRTIPEPTK